MSMEVPIDELFRDLASWGAGFLTTVGSDGRVRFVSIRPTTSERDGRRLLRFAKAGRSACANVVERPDVSIVFPPHPGSGGFSLIVDGRASLDDSADDVVDVEPTWAVKHRPAPAV